MTGLTLVTGASGFLGRTVVDHWVARGLPVRAMVRRGPSFPEPVETAFVSDLSDRAAVREAVQGVDTVIHLAARVHVMSELSPDPMAEFRKVNVEGTQVMVTEATRQGVGLFVLTSSVKAVGEESTHAWTETTVPDPVDPYGRSKLEAERVVEAASERTGMPSIVLRLPLVYGPGVGANFLRLFRAVDRGLPLPFAAVHNARSLACSVNVAAAIEGLSARRPSGSELFMVSDGAPVSTADLVRRIAAVLDRPSRLIPVPSSAFRLAGRIGDVVDRAVTSPWTSGHVQRLLGSLAVDSRKLAEWLPGWPAVSLDDGLRLTARWFREHF